MLDYNAVYIDSTALAIKPRYVPTKYPKRPIATEGNTNSGRFNDVAKAKAVLGPPIEACEATKVSARGHRHQRRNSNKPKACKATIIVAKTRTGKPSPSKPLIGEFKPITVKNGWISSKPSS